MSRRTAWMLALAFTGLALAACGPKPSLFLDAGRGEGDDHKHRKPTPAKTPSAMPPALRTPAP